MTIVTPAYGERSLADVLPAVLRSLGCPGERPTSLRLPEARAAAVLLVDGLGAELLRAHAADAPFLASLEDAGPLTVGFPSSTSISLASLGTGLPPGVHGILGISFRMPGGAVLDSLQWRAHGGGPHVDLRESLPPEEVQPAPTALERAAAAGIHTTTISKQEFAGSGLTRAVLRGGDFKGAWAMGDLTAQMIDGVSGPDRSLCYGYHADLDLLGHIYGPGSEPWRMQLRQVDRLAASVADGLPRDGMLLVTGDHGMVTRGETFDADADADLQEGVTALAGDPRSRHVYCEPGAQTDVLATWRERLGEAAWVLSRDQAISEGWFGPVAPGVEQRIGDVVVAMRGEAVVVRSSAEPLLSQLIGQHGSLTSAEQHVPLLVARAE